MFDPRRTLVLAVLFTLAGLILGSPQSYAVDTEFVTNGSFETGDLTGWTTSANYLAGTNGYDVLQNGEAGTSGQAAPAPSDGSELLQGYQSVAAGYTYAVYQDITIPADATQALLSFDTGVTFNGIAADATDIFRVDLCDTNGDPDTLAYAGGNILNGAAALASYSGNGGDSALPQAYGPTDVLGFADVSPGDTVRVRIFTQRGGALTDEVLGLADSFTLIVTTPKPPIVPSPPVPDPRPEGGQANQLGGGDSDDPPALPPGYTSTADENGSFSLQRSAPIAFFSQRSGASSVRPANSLIPALMMRTSTPNGDNNEYWLPLGESGNLPNGVLWGAAMSWNYDLRMVDLNLTWPQATLSAMAPGPVTLTYWLQDPEGLRSNPRWEFLNIGSGPTSASALRALVPEGDSELTFKLQLSVFSRTDGVVHRVREGLCQVETASGVWGAFPIVDGLLTATIPFGQTSRMRFTSQEFGGTKTIRMEFADGFVTAYDEDHRNSPLAVYQDLDGPSYAFEYYQELLYICNQGDPDGPILGQLYGK